MEVESFIENQLSGLEALEETLGLAADFIISLLVVGAPFLSVEKVPLVPFCLPLINKVNKIIGRVKTKAFH